MDRRPLFPSLGSPDNGEAVRVGGEALSYRELAGAAAALANRVAGSRRVAVWAEPTLEAVVAVVGSLAAGVTVVPVNPGSGARELEHIAADSAPELFLAPASLDAPAELATIERVDVDPRATGGALPDELGDEQAALVLYTSGTTGLPKGVQIPRRAIESNLAALVEIWEWTPADRLVHALPFFHVHGLVLGLFGPLRLGGSVEHAGRFSPGAVADALRRGGTMLFGVPTMYHRIGAEAENDPDLARAFGGARLLVSGSAALPLVEHERIRARTGQLVLERYGMTETLMNCGVRLGGPAEPGRVGPPLPGVDLKLVDDDGTDLDTQDDETIGEVAVRGPNLFLGYLNRDDATAEAMRDGWLLTGDLATRNAAGSIRLVGRRATDLIKSGGFKIGAGEIEGALLEHPAVAEAAVAGRPDPDLGERIAAWVVLRDDASAKADELVSHVATLLSGHKRPREVHFVDALPRNAMGKVMKRALVPGGD